MRKEAEPPNTPNEYYHYSSISEVSGGGIQNGKAYGANVVQPKVNIRPGKIFDEKGDVTGPRNEKEWVQKDKERWANEGRTAKYIK